MLNKFKKLMKRLYSCFRTAAGRIDRAIVFIFHIIALAFLISSSVLLISLTVAQFEGAGTISNEISLLFLGLFGINKISPETAEYRQILSALVGSIAVMVTLWFAIVTAVKHLHNRSALRRHTLIETKPVFEDGVEDLNYMFEYFKKANSVTVFSGDFSWLTTHSQLRTEVQRLAREEKIRLVSSKSMERVKKAIDDESIFNSLEKHFKFDSGVDLKCSLVNNNSSSAFLYKIDRSLENGPKSVCIISGRGDANYLLRTLHQLCLPLTKIERA